MSTASPYPEHDKMALVADDSETIGQFLDSEDHPYVLAEWQHFYEDDQGNQRELVEPRLVPVHKRIDQILAEYFDIDLQKVEAEKRQMLANIRELED